MTLRYGIVALAVALCFPLAHADDMNSSIASIAPTTPVVSPMVAQPSTDDLWQRIRGRFALPNVDDDLVHRQEAYYASHPEYLARIFDRGGKYLHFIVEEVERRNMPAEIALLPMIESAYNPKAYSRAKAAGIWQFIPSTGARYGLEQTYWYDGRCDVFAATGAALDYLQFLYTMFGDWQLALAAYNWGEGGVSRSIAHNQAQGQPADYASISMPWETRNYVPKLLAIRNIIANPQQFGITLPPLENKPALAVITTNRHMDLAVAASLAGMSESDFLELNPGYKRPVIAYKAERRLLLPLDKAQTFADNLSARTEPLLNWAPYQVERGDTISKLAERYHCSADGLRQMNKVSGNRLRHDLVLLVPHSGTDVASTRAVHIDIPGDRALTMKPGATELPLLASNAATPALSTNAAQPANAAPVDQHNPQPDAQPTNASPAPASDPAAVATTVTPVVSPPVATSIAMNTTATPAATNTAATAAATTPTVAAVTPTAPATVATTPAAGHPDTPNASAPVATVVAVTPEAPAATPTSDTDDSAAPVTYHTVASGDTAFNVARHYGLSVTELLRLNGLHNARLHLGQTLLVAAMTGTDQRATAISHRPNIASAVPAVEHKHAEPSTKSYRVRRGDTPASIARHFNVEVSELMRWNKLKHAARLRAGETVLIRLASTESNLPD